MNVARLRPWDYVVALLGILLLGVLRLDWYEELGAKVTGYQAYSVTDVLLVLLALLAIGAVVTTAAARRPAVPLPFLVVSTALGFLMILVLAVRLLNPPGSNAEVGLEPGAWLGFACVLALFYATYRALRDERAPAIEPTPPPERMPAPAARSEAPTGR